MKKGGTMTRRWVIWLPLLGISLWLALAGDRSPASEATGTLAAQTQRPDPAEYAPGRSIVSDSTAPLLALVPREVLVPKSSGGHGSRRDLFATRSWTPTPAPQALQPPVPVAAPPLPYTFLGKKLEAGAWEVYLGRGDRTFIAREGLVLEGTYRVTAIAPPTLSVTYLPLEQAQSLAIGDSR